MDIVLKKAQESDLSFLKKMLYNAVFWRAIANNTERPSFEEGIELAGVKEALSGWGREGDVAVIAFADYKPAGAAWYRY